MLSRTKFPALALLVAGVFLCVGAVQAQEKSAKVLAKGEFHKADKAGSGTATLYLLLVNLPFGIIMALVARAIIGKNP